MKSIRLVRDVRSSSYRSLVIYILQLTAENPVNTVSKQEEIVIYTNYSFCA